MGFVLIHGARQLITLHGAPGPRCGPAAAQLQIINDGAVLIEGSLIREVGPTRRLENLAAARKARDIPAAGRVVMPGFVDCHTHLISGPSSFGDEGGSPFKNGSPDARVILGNVPFVRDAAARRLVADATLVLRQSLRYGTTTLAAKSGFGLSFSAELKILRALMALGDAPITVVPVLCAAPAIPPEFEGRVPDYVDWASRELVPAVHKRGLARFVDAVADRGAFRAAELRPLLAAAQSLGLPLKLTVAAFGPSDGAALAREFPLTSADHLDHLDEAGIAALAEAGTTAVLAPAASFFLHRQHAPARALIDRGVPVALASNYNRVTSPTCNMQLAIFLACHELRMTPPEAITAATINAAHALKLGYRIGSLEAGKQADLLILNAGDFRELAYEFGVNLVDMTLKQGAVVTGSPGVKWPAQS